jgi:hypothetical protein
MSERNITKQMQADQALMAGIQAHNSTSTFTIQSGVQTSAQVVAVLEARVAKTLAVFTARAALHQAVLDSRAESANTAGYVKDLRQTLLAMYSNSSQTLSDYGIVVPKPRSPLSPEQKVIASAKRAATRAARHTQGKVQKAKIQGTITGPVVVQIDGSSQVASSGNGTSGASASAATPPAPAMPAAPATSSSSNGASASGH